MGTIMAIVVSLFTLALLGLGAIFFIKHFKTFIWIIVGLILVAVVIGFITDPGAFKAVGWFIFSGICLFVGIAIMRSIRRW